LFITWCLYKNNLNIKNAGGKLGGVGISEGSFRSVNCGICVVVFLGLGGIGIEITCSTVV